MGNFYSFFGSILQNKSPFITDHVQTRSSPSIPTTSPFCSIENTTPTKGHCLNCLFNDPILNWSVPFKLKPLFTKSDID